MTCIVTVIMYNTNTLIDIQKIFHTNIILYDIIVIINF